MIQSNQFLAPSELGWEANDEIREMLLEFAAKVSLVKAQDMDEAYLKVVAAEAMDDIYAKIKEYQDA